MSDKMIITLVEIEGEETNKNLAQANSELLNTAAKIVAKVEKNGKPITKMRFEFDAIKGYAFASSSTEEKTETDEIKKFGSNVMESTKTLSFHTETLQESLPAIEDMRKKNMTQENIATKLNISQSSVSKLLGFDKKKKKSKKKKKKI